MKRYLFSIFTRLFIAGSSFLVFLVSASLFGASGRGIISYGTSLFAFFGLIFCFNLGRSFLAETSQNETLKKELMSDYLNLNLISMALTCFVAFSFWFFSHSAREILDIKIMISLIVSSVFYVWSINSTSIFAVFQETHTQEKFFLYTRGILCAVLGIFYWFKIYKISYFVGLYSIVLGGGATFEIIYLYKKLNLKLQLLSFKRLKEIIKVSFWPHLDYLAFNLFPLILILISGKFLEKQEIGRISFAMQFVNVIFLLSTVANVRISSYVSVVGFAARKALIKKLFLLTIFISYLLALVMYYILIYITEKTHFSTFDGTAELFLFTLFSIPGFVIYQFVSPVWLEIGFIKRSAIANLGAIILVSIISFFTLSQGSSQFAMINFSLFYIAIMCSQFYLLKTSKILIKA